MPFGKISGKLSTNRWIPAKTKKDKQQDKKIAKVSRFMRSAEVKTYTRSFYNFQSNVTVVTSVADPSTPDTSVIFPLTGTLAQGTSGSLRTGVQISVTGISIRVLVYDPTTAGSSRIADFVRVMLVYDKRYAGTYLNKTQILETSTVTDQHFDDLLSDYDIDNVDSKQERGTNVSILWDRTAVFGRNFLASASAACSTDQSTKLLVYNKKFKTPKKIIYSSLGGPRQMYLVVCSGPWSTTAYCPVVNIVSTVYYNDF